MRIASLLGYSACWLSLVSCACYAAPASEKIPSVLRATPLPPQKLRGQIAYIQNGDLWVVQPSTRKTTLLFKGKNFHTDFRDVDWNADLSQLVFSRQAEGELSPQNNGSEIYVMRWDGKQSRRLTNTGFHDLSSQPQWSSDGRSIAYAQQEGYRMGGPGLGSSALKIVGVDGSNDRFVLSPTPARTFLSPQWSRDGSQLLLLARSGSSDTSEGAGPVEPFTTSITNPEIQKFDGDFRPFFGRGISHDGQKLVRVVDILGARTLNVQNTYQDLVGDVQGGTTQGIYPWGDPLGGPGFDTKDSRVAVSVSLLNVKFDSKGHATFSSYFYGQRITDLWVFSVSIGGPKPRLLVRNAYFVEWL